jgi:hypothetical protein
MESQFLEQLKGIRKELHEALERLGGTGGEGEGPDDDLQEPRAELMTLCKEFANFLAKKKRCDCGCCTEEARVYSHFEVSIYIGSSPSGSENPC